jgi:putative copper export protein
MKNPWTKKNPFMSMWLSGANTIAGAARGHASAEAKRQATAFTNEASKQVADFWTGALTPTTTRRKKRSR